MTTVHLALVDGGSRRLRALHDTLVALGAEVTTVALDAANDIVPSLDAVTGMVISGGPRLFTREPELLDRFSFIDAYPHPLLGVCLGHQALGLRHGARITLGDLRKGRHAVQVTSEHPLFAGLGSEPSFDTDHRESIALPQGFIRLASSTYDAVEAMVHPRLSHFGVQFHPETSDAVGQRLLGNFVGMCRNKPV